MKSNITLKTMALGGILCVIAVASAESSNLAFSKYFLRAGGCWSCGGGGTNCPSSKGSAGRECGLNGVSCSDQCNSESGEECQYVDGAAPISCITVSISCPDGVDYECVNNVCTDIGTIACATRSGCSL